MNYTGLELALHVAGGPQGLAALLGISHQAIYQWKRIPIGRVLEIEHVTNLPREMLRPDMYAARPRDRTRGRKTGAGALP